MKSREKSWYKCLFSSKSSFDAVTAVVGSLIMLLLTFILTGAAAVIIYDNIGENSNSQTPMAKITLESCEGGLSNNGPETEQASFEKNKLVLLHEGGSPLPLDTTCIKISGNGDSYRPLFGQGILKGNISILYLDLSSGGKNPTFYVVNNKATLADGSWNVGERLVLCGQDSAEGSIESSVKVSVDGDSNTSDNYGFKAGSEIDLRVIDSKSSNIIVKQKTIVRHAGE